MNLTTDEFNIVSQSDFGRRGYKVEFESVNECEPDILINDEQLEQIHAVTGCSFIQASVKNKKIHITLYFNNPLSATSKIIHILNDFLGTSDDIKLEPITFTP